MVVFHYIPHLSIFKKSLQTDNLKFIFTESIYKDYQEFPIWLGIDKELV